MTEVAKKPALGQPISELAVTNIANLAEKLGIPKSRVVDGILSFVSEEAATEAIGRYMKELGADKAEATKRRRELAEKMKHMSVDQLEKLLAAAGDKNA